MWKLEPPGVGCVDLVKWPDLSDVLINFSVTEMPPSELCCEHNLWLQMLRTWRRPRPARRFNVTAEVRPETLQWPPNANSGCHNGPAPSPSFLHHPYCFSSFCLRDTALQLPPLGELLAQTDTSMVFCLVSFRLCSNVICVESMSVMVPPVPCSRCHGTWAQAPGLGVAWFIHSIRMCAWEHMLLQVWDGRSGGALQGLCTIVYFP